MELTKKTEIWLDHMQAWRKSGMAQVEYCATYGLHQKTFSNWKTKLYKHLPDLPNKTRASIVPPAPRNPFLEVTIGNDSPANTSKIMTDNVVNAKIATSKIQLYVKENYRVSIEVGFDVATLQKLLAVLAE